MESRSTASNSAIGTFLILLTATPAPIVAGPDSLEITAFVSEALGRHEELVVEIHITNVGLEDVVIPSLHRLNQASYIRCELIHTATGTSAFFLDPLAEPPRAVATATLALAPGEKTVLEVQLNRAGLGPIGYTEPGRPERLLGMFEVRAALTVNEDNLPIGGDAAVIRGTVETEAAAVIEINEGTIFSDGFESGDTTSWSRAVPS